MNLSARVSRLEYQQGGSDPLDNLTDEELDAAIEALNRASAAALGITPEEAASDAYVSIPVELPDDMLRAIVAKFKRGDYT